MASLGRSLRYLLRYPRLTIGATLSLIIATAAQLVVPQLVQRIIDTIVTNATNQGILSLPANVQACLLYTSPSPRDRTRSRMPSSA